MVTTQQRLATSIELYEWLVSMTEAGVMECVVDAFIDELRPLAAAAARKAIAKEIPAPNTEVMLQRMTPLLVELKDLLEDMTLDPDLMAVATSRREDIFRLGTDLNDFLYAVGCLRESPEANVPPSAAAILVKGGIP